MYYRLTQGFDSIGTFVAENENIANYIDKDKDYYLSVYKYSETQKKLAEEIIEAKNKDGSTYKRPRGVVGMEDVKTNLLIFDLDHKKDISLAKADAITVVNRLGAAGVPADQINVSFSGGKGFSVVLSHDTDLTPDEHKTIAKALAGDLKTWDAKVYNSSRIFRIDNTKHNSSGLYKTPLAAEELVLPVEEIKALAQTSSDYMPLVKTKLPTKILNMKPVVVEKTSNAVIDANLDFSKKPYYLSDVKFALQKGYIPEGDGNEGMMILCSTYKGAGFDQNDAFSLLKSVNEKRASIYGIEERSDDSIWKEVVQYVYSPNWKGGTYSPKENDLLQRTAKDFGITSTSKVEGIESIAKDFLKFAKNINHNVVKTGIKSLDEAVLMTTGMLVGILGAPSAGKCLGKGTQIRMFDGTLKEVEDIVVGDLLMGDDSTSRKVLSTCTGQEQLYRVDQLNGNSYVVNESHILCLKNNVNFIDTKRKNKFETEQINIEVRDYLKQSKLFKKHYKGYKVGVEYDQQETALDPYVMGLWLGDGTSAKPDITNIDTEIIDYLDVYFSKFNLTRKTYDKITHSYTTNAGNDGYRFNFFKESLKKEQVLNNKHIPDNYLINSRINRLRLLAGLIDSDGSYDAKRNSYEISFTNEVLVKHTLELIRSLGFKATLTKKEVNFDCVAKGKRYVGQTETNRIYFSGKNLNDIPVLLERKRATLGDRKVSYDQTGIKLEKLEVGDYYGFEIDGNRKFLLEDFTVTHNTSLVTSIIENTAKTGQVPLFHSLDMHKHLMSMRLIQRVSGMSAEKKLRQSIIGDPNYNKDYDMATDPDIIKAIDDMTKLYKNVEFNFTRGATIESIEEDIKSNKAKHGDKFKLVVVDYLEKVRGPYSDATANSGFIASRLSDLASTYDVAVIVLLQPQKSAGDPSEELLSMRKVKGASVIEQDCRVILTMWRPGFSPKDSQNDKFATVAIVKNNMGEVRTLDYKWSGLKGELNELTKVERDQLKSLRDAILAAKEEDKGNGWDM